MFPACYLIQNLQFIQVPAEINLFILLANITGVFNDFLVFGVCFHNVWDTWRLQRNVHLQGKVGLVSILLRQGESIKP